MLTKLTNYPKGYWLDSSNRNVNQHGCKTNAIYYMNGLKDRSYMLIFKDSEIAID